ncbi:kinase-like protein [Rhizophagus irregularis]|uniref:Kinase-like protein n=1 Tax=Rhizophagus irregularis TaxID=588596 RepID=A0A2N0PUA3_9GLOM|nr:kinase-like protein [Rhizophagus irregularis]
MLSEYKFDILDSLDFDSDEELPHFGNCPKCDNEYNAPAWCDACDQKELVDKFDKWSTGNDNINLLIQESQRLAPDYYNYLEFIPYNHFVDIERIAEGGFGVVYKATWLDGIRKAKKEDNGIWIKTRSEPCTVALKEIEESKNIDQDYINELKANIEFHRSDIWMVCRYYGISQNPKSMNFILVMEYLPKGDIKNVLFNKGKDRLKWHKKIQYLYFICNGLRGIHMLDYVHGDIHGGNILIKYTSDICITDLGLSRPANSKETTLLGYDSKSKTSGLNVPHAAPELLLDDPNSKESDIYAIGILMTEFASHNRAFENYNTNDLRIEIFKGIRPKFPLETPKCYVELMEKCLDEDPKKRPTAEELVKTISGWLKLDWKSKSNPFNIADKQWNKSKKNHRYSLFCMLHKNIFSINNKKKNL